MSSSIIVTDGALALPSPLGIASGGTGANLSATGPGFLYQASNGAVVSLKPNPSNYACIVFSTGSQSLPSSAFTTIAMTASYDPSGSFASSIYTVPVTGIYQILTKMRLNDNVTANVNYGQGAGTSNIDGTWFAWATTVGDRQGLQNFRVAAFNAGDQIRMYAYVDGTSLMMASAEMDITFLG